MTLNRDNEKFQSSKKSKTRQDIVDELFLDHSVVDEILLSTTVLRDIS